MAAISHIARPQAPGARLDGSAVTLRKAERGFVYGGGPPSPRTMQPGTAAVIFASEVATVPRWPDVQVAVQSEYRYRIKITLSETYNDVQAKGDPISPERKGGLIPHSTLSRTRNGSALPQTDWTLGTKAYLLKNHSYTGSEGAAETIFRGECVFIRSPPRTLKSLSLTTNPSLAYYAFQRTTETNPNKIFLSAEKIHEGYLA